MKKELFLFFLIFLLSTFLRLYQINSIPPGLHGDEAQSGLEAIKILNGSPYTPYSPEVYGQTTFYFYLVAVVFKFFGLSATSIRLTSALLGIITIPLFYFFVRYCLGKDIALFSTFFLAISRWHIHLSRLGFMTIMTNLFLSGVFLFLLKGLRDKKITNFILAGLFLALGLNSYMAFRFVLFILIIFLAFLVLFRREFLKGNFLGLFLFLATTIVISLPLITYAYTNWDIFMGRIYSISTLTNHPSQEATTIILKNLKGALLMFNYRGSTWPHKNLPGAPMLDPITGVFFLIGLILAFTRLKQPIYFLLIINFLIMLGISVFSESVYPPAGDPIRSNGAILSVIVFAGIGIYTFWCFLKKFRYIALPLLLFALFLNFRAYFYSFAQDQGVWHDFHTVPVAVAKIANANPGVHIYLLSDWFYSDYLSIRFLSPNFSGEDFFYKLGQYSPKDDLFPLKENLDKDALFIICPYYQNYLFRLKEIYPEGEVSRYWEGSQNQVLLDLFFIPQKIVKAKITKE